MDKHLDENNLLLVQLYCSRGHYNDTFFGGSVQKKTQFLNDNGLRLFADDYEKAIKDYDNAMTAEEQQKARQHVYEAATRIRQNVKSTLLTKGIDLDAIYGKEPTREEAVEMLYDQLQQLGMSRQTIQDMGLQNIEEILFEGGKNFRFEVKDTEQNRRAFDRQDIDYEARDGRLHAKARVEAAEGVAIEDTPDNRRLLDENEIEYIDMAMNINPKRRQAMLFVPSTWRPAFHEQMRNDIRQSVHNVWNNHYSKNFLKVGALLATGIALPFHPIFTLAAFIIMKKMGLFERKQKEIQPTPFEKRALKAGHTVYKEVKKNGQIKGQYLCMHDGNLVRINAHDVRIPEYIKGVHLTPLQREQFRKGEAVELKDKHGETFWARIDIANPNLYREYYKEIRSDRTAKPVPNTLDSDEDKLRYIAHAGSKGIRDIYGPANVNVDRDAFLSKYNMKDKFYEMLEIQTRITRSNSEAERAGHMENWKKDNQSLREIAENEVISLARGNSRKI